MSANQLNALSGRVQPAFYEGNQALDLTPHSLKTFAYKQLETSEKKDYSSLVLSNLCRVITEYTVYGEDLIVETVQHGDFRSPQSLAPLFSIAPDNNGLLPIGGRLILQIARTLNDKIENPDEKKRYADYLVAAIDLHEKLEKILPIDNFGHAVSQALGQVYLAPRAVNGR
jgi:hypothetical protein